jgi:hypothetical protein
MTEPWNMPNPDPTPEQLAAYADGELDPRSAQQVEAWLADRPGAAAEVEALRGLKGVWQTHAAPEPSPEAWETVLAGIETQLAQVRGNRPARGRWRLWPWVLGGAAAALLLLLLSRPFWRGPAPRDDGEEPFPVADNGDVVILSMDANDVAALVVGHPPVQGEIVLASHDEIQVLEGQDWRPRDEGGAPMVIDPLAMPR